MPQKINMQLKVHYIAILTLNSLSPSSHLCLFSFTSCHLTHYSKAFHVFTLSLSPFFPPWIWTRILLNTYKWYKISFFFLFKFSTLCCTFRGTALNEVIHRAFCVWICSHSAGCLSVSKMVWTSGSWNSGWLIVKHLMEELTVTMRLLGS